MPMHQLLFHRQQVLVFNFLELCSMTIDHELRLVVTRDHGAVCDRRFIGMSRLQPSKPLVVHRMALHGRHIGYMLFNLHTAAVVENEEAWKAINTHSLLRPHKHIRDLRVLVRLHSLETVGGATHLPRWARLVTAKHKHRAVDKRRIKAKPVENTSCRPPCTPL